MSPYIYRYFHQLSFFSWNSTYNLMVYLPTEDPLAPKYDFVRLNQSHYELPLSKKALLMNSLLQKTFRFTFNHICMKSEHNDFSIMALLNLRSSTSTFSSCSCSTVFRILLICLDSILDLSGNMVWKNSAFQALVIVFFYISSILDSRTRKR